MAKIFKQLHKYIYLRKYIKMNYKQNRSPIHIILSTAYVMQSNHIDTSQHTVEFYLDTLSPIGLRNILVIIDRTLKRRFISKRTRESAANFQITITCVYNERAINLPSKPVRPAIYFICLPSVLHPRFHNVTKIL